MMVEFTALDPRNPTAYMAALGALRLLSDAGVADAGLGWRAQGGSGMYRAYVTGEGLDGPEDVVNMIFATHARRDLAAELGWERDVMAIEHRQALEVFDRASSLRELHFVGACIAELPLRPDGRVPYTPLRVTPRLGRARFLDTLRRISSAVSEQDLGEALFGPWKYTKVNNMRWDPGARMPVRAYAAEAPTNFGPNGVRGAIMLAAAGLVFFPLLTSGRGVACPGVATRGAGDRADRRRRLQRFTLPIWTDALEEHAVALTLKCPALQGVPNVVDWPRLRSHSIAATVTYRRESLGSDSDTLSWGELLEDPGSGSDGGGSDGPSQEAGLAARLEAAAI